MPAYDCDFSDLPAPLASVTLRNANTAKNVTNVPMLLDTGSDTTLIPRLAVTALGIAETLSEDISLVGFDGSAQIAMVASVEILFLIKSFRSVFPVTDNAHGVLGRDILNLLRLVFDGPRLVWEEAPSVR